MELYNSLTKIVGKVSPIDGTTIRMYSCGPTVYNHAHIGNIGSYIFADTLRRVIQASGHKVRQVMNFTDVDDKTINRSREQYPDLKPHEALSKLTNKYSQQFLNDMQAVGNDVAVIDFVKATDSIAPMQQLIKELLAKSFAYIADDGIYFSIDAYKKSGKTYGQFSDITLSSTSQARIRNDEYDKASAHDFALWKNHKNGEPSWDFMLDGQNISGRPGWHLECSAMSAAAFGLPFDVHTGGVDLQFPHHENEIAQSTATLQNPLYAAIFAHNEHLLVDGRKMSKGFDNFFTLADIEAKNFDPLAFRLLILQAHYRKQAHFSWKNLNAAQNRLTSYINMAELSWQPLLQDKTELPSDYFSKALATINGHMFDDLNTPMALSALSSYCDLLTNSHIASTDIAEFKEFLIRLDELLGLRLSEVPDITEAQKQLIQDREAARSRSDWTASDSFRDQLQEQDIKLRDSQYGAIWFRA